MIHEAGELELAGMLILENMNKLQHVEVHIFSIKMFANSSSPAS